MAPQNYYLWNSKKTKTFNKTPKQFRLLDDEGGWRVVKPLAEYQHQNGVLHTYTFADGTTRQWFFIGDYVRWTQRGRHDPVEDAPAYYTAVMKEMLARARSEESRSHNTPGKHITDFGFVVHPDDKVFRRHRLVLAVHECIAHYSVVGDTRHHTFSDVRDFVFYGRGHFVNKDNGHSVVSYKVSPVVVCETWVKWGQIELLLDDGLRKWAHYSIGDTRVENYAPRKGKFLTLLDFHASPDPNPFDDPFEPELKEMRDKRNEMCEEIAQKAFHPDRVWRMMETYGEDWWDRV